MWTLTDKWCFLYLMEVNTYKVTAWLLTGTGMMSVLTAILGYTAVVCESRCLLGTVSGSCADFVCITVCILAVHTTVLIVMLFMMESIIGLLSYVYQEQVARDLGDSLEDIFIHRYDDDRDVSEAVDEVQQQVGNLTNFPFAIFFTSLPFL